MAVIFIFSTSMFSDRATSSVLGRILDLFWSGYTYRDLEIINHIIRKLAHVTVYGVLALLWYRALMVGAAYGHKKALLVGLLIAMAVAVTDEAHQSLVPGRTAKPADAALDTCAAAIALLGLSKRIKIKAPS